MSKKPIIAISCRGAECLPHQKLIEYQGELKILDEFNYEKLRKNILTDGFSAPIFVWPNQDKFYILDGHQRIRVIRVLAAEGYIIPDLPVVLIHAKDHDDAKKRLLSLTSQFGKVDGQGLYEYLIKNNIDPRELEDTYRLQEVKTQKFMAEYFDFPQPEIPELKPRENHKLVISLSNAFDANALHQELIDRGYLVEIKS